VSELDRYIPERSWFTRQATHDYAGTHGIGHITRVLVWSARLAELLESVLTQPLRREELFWAAGLHDICRATDGRDREHGARAADWVLTEFPRVRPAQAATLDLELIASLCRGHVPPDNVLPADAWSAELRVLKDADGLERVRIHDLDPTRLRWPVSASLEPAAWQLLDRSLALGNDADAVRAAALEMGLWR
jgi:hypothetical protein